MFIYKHTYMYLCMFEISSDDGGWFLDSKQGKYPVNQARTVLMSIF